MKNILLIVSSNGYQSLEYSVTKKVLEDANFVVTTGSDTDSQAVADDGTVTKVNITLEKIYSQNFDGIFFIGGPGALTCLDNQESNRILNEAMILQKVYGAICIAPRILAKAHVLVGKRATGWDEDGLLSQIFSQNNVEYIREGVVIDENIITARDRYVAQEFAEAIVKFF